MTKYLSTLAFALFLFCTHLEADTITVTDTIDFEGSNDAMNIASFSQLDRVTIEFDQNVMGSNDSEVAEFMIAGVSPMNATFAGVIIGEFDLAINPLVTAGSVTVSDLAEFTFSFDAEVVGTGLTGLRFEPLGGGFNERINLDISPIGGFQNYFVDLGTLDTGQSTNLVNSLNSQSITQIQFALDFVGPPHELGNTVRLDNLTLSTVVAVPEPSATFMFSLVSLYCLGRRRRA